VGIYKELAEVVLSSQIDVFGAERVLPPLLMAGITVDEKGQIHNVAESNEERVFRRMWITLTRSLGGLAMSTSKSALASYCTEKHLPAAKILGDL